MNSSERDELYFPLLAENVVSPGLQKDERT